MTENKKPNSKRFRNAPLLNAGMSIFGKKPNQTTPMNHKRTKLNTMCMADNASEGEGQLKKQKSRTLYVTSPKPLVSHIFSMLF